MFSQKQDYLCDRRCDFFLGGGRGNGRGRVFAIGVRSSIHVLPWDEVEGGTML